MRKYFIQELKIIPYSKTAKGQSLFKIYLNNDSYCIADLKYTSRVIEELLANSMYTLTELDSDESSTEIK